jgi:hypothetical protein
VAGHHPKPTPAIIERELALAYEPSMTREALQVVEETVQKHKELRAMALGGMKRIRENGHFIRQRSSNADPREALNESIARLERAEAR